MNSIGKYLSRWVDVKTETKAGGLTYIGSHRRKKRSWMINLTGASTFEADAVIIATPATQAYGVIQTATDEINTLKIIREIDDVHYTPCYSLMAGYGDRELPSWDGVVCKNTGLEFISNEATKRAFDQECSLVYMQLRAFAVPSWKRGRHHYSGNARQPGYCHWWMGSGSAVESAALLEIQPCKQSSESSIHGT